MVVPGCRLAVDAVTNLPVTVDLLTAFLFEVLLPTRSVDVVRGLRWAVPLVTNLPVLALLLTVRAITQSSLLAVASRARTANQVCLESGSYSAK